MNCDKYRKYELGELGEDDFTEHLRGCPLCQKYLQQDTRLLTLTKSLKQPVSAPLLWPKIENALRVEHQRHRPVLISVLRQQKLAILRLAAVLILAGGLGSYFLFKPERSDSRLLAGAALQKVEEKEREYAAAIAELERIALPQMAKMDTELMLLYRDRLETIDAQIERCQEALAGNPANAHIRRYLLAAMQDKKETLQELVKYESPI